MKYKLTKTIFFTFLTLCPLWGFSQNYHKMPEKFSDYVSEDLLQDIYNGRKSLQEIAEQGTTELRWIVYSDRNNNILYDSPDGWKNDDELEFGERVAVKKIDGQWLNVYSPAYKEKNKNIEHHKERGWIKAKNVILTSYAQLNTKGITKKAMALNTIDFEKKNLNKKRQYRFYYRPDKNSNKKGIVRKFSIFYVLKSEGSYVLLSNSDKLSGNNIEGDLLGWIPNRNVTPWNTRLCLEPSSNQISVDEYNDDTLYTFSKIEYLNNFLEYEKKPMQKEYYKIDILSSDRLDPRIMRKPVLKNINSQKKEVATINSIKSTSGKEKARIEEKLINLKNKKEIINILFVLDATQSMDAYYPSVARSIEGIIKNKNLAGDKTKLRFGLAIYRDYPDHNKAYEIIPLTTDHKKIINKLHTTTRISKDTDLPEALYQGLIKGIRDAGFDAQSSNIIVLAGDCGNHPDDPKYSITDVIQQLQKYNLSMITFQVIYGNHNTYDDFNWDIQDMLRGTAKKHTNNENIKLTETGVENTYKLDYSNIPDEEKCLYSFGRFTYASGSKPMDTKLIETNIENLIYEYNNIVGNAITILKNQITGKESVSPTLKKYLESIGWTDEEIGILENMGEFTARGYISTNYYGNEEEAFTPVVFMSITEKQQIDEVFSRLVSGDLSISERKLALQNALLEECKKMLGNESTDIILDKTIDEVWQIILAVPFTGDPLIRNKRLREIKSLPDDDFKKFYMDFEKKANDFRNNDFRYSKFELADQYFYWIPLKEMPGNE